MLAFGLGAEMKRLICTARRKLAEHGIGCAGKTARQMISRDYQRYHLLVGMDWANLRKMNRICGGNWAGKKEKENY